MSTETWAVVEQKWCDYIGQDVVMLERRVHPSQRLPDNSGFQAAGRKCTADIACNLAGISCKWAYTNPCCDQFVETK